MWYYTNIYVVVYKIVAVYNQSYTCKCGCYSGNYFDISDYVSITSFSCILFLIGREAITGNLIFQRLNYQLIFNFGTISSSSLQSYFDETLKSNNYLAAANMLCNPFWCRWFFLWWKRINYLSCKNKIKSSLNTEYCKNNILFLLFWWQKFYIDFVWILKSPSILLHY